MTRFILKYFFFPAVALGLTMLVMSTFFGVKFVPEGSQQQLKEFMETGKEAEHNHENKALIGGPFTLINQRGETVSNEDFKGKLMLVYFGFANCPDVCPTDLANISGAMELLSEEERAQVVPLFITLDPARDTQESLALYMQNFDPSIQGLTGSEEEIEAASKAYRIFAKKVKMEGMSDYMIQHSAYIYLMDREGEYKLHFRHNTPSEEIADVVRGAL